jgi:integrase
MEPSSRNVLFQDAMLRALRAPENGQIEYSDTLTPGLRIRVGKRSKTFVLLHTVDGQRQRVTIGPYPAVTLGKARETVRTLKAQNRLGLLATKPALSFPECVEEFLAGKRKKNKASTVSETERLLKRHFPFTSDVTRIADRDIIKALENIAAPSEARHAYVQARSLFNWLVKTRRIPFSPLAGIEPPRKGRDRERVLTGDEIGRLLRLPRNLAIVRIMLLLLLSGQRLGQVANLRREFIDEDTGVISWPADLMKGNRRHSIPLTPMVAEILKDLPQAGLLFPTRKGTPYNNWSASKNKLDALCPLPHWTLHDLRRTVATHLAGLGIAPHVIERILAHSGGTISGVAAIYNRFSYMFEMRDALQK